MRVMFVTSNSWLSRIIRWVDGGPFSHVAIIDTNTAVQAVWTGVEEVSRAQFMAGVTNFHMIDIGIVDDKKALAFARSQIKSPYDFLAISVLVWRRIFGTSPRWDSSGRFFCDELVLLSGIEGGLNEPVDMWPRFYGVERTRQYLLSQTLQGE